MGLCLPGGFSDIVCDSMNHLLHIISWGSRYFNYPIIPTDLMAPASDVMRETSSLRENEKIGSFVSPCVTSYR